MKIGIPVEMMSDELPDIKQRIDSLLMEDETTWMSAEEISSATGLPLGLIVPTLFQMLKRGKIRVNAAGKKFRHIKK
jgi:hypothetical protein